MRISLNSLVLRSISNSTKVKHKLKSNDFYDNEMDEDTVDFKRKRKKNKVNSDAVASVQSARENEDLNDRGNGVSRYSKDNIQQLMDSQFKSNRTVSEYIQKTNPNEIIKNYLSDEEFDDSEKEKIKNIIKTKHKIKNSQTGMAMNAGKEEFLTPKDIFKAKEEIINLSESINVDHMYSMNTTKQDMVVDDSLEGESWIDNQLLYALGVDHIDTEQNLLAPYQSGSNPTDLIETAEMRAIKRDLDKPANDYVNELDLQIDQLHLSIKRNKETKESIAKGILSNEKEVETADLTIRENVTGFKLLIEITGVIEDLTSMLDEKEEQINEIYIKHAKL